MGWWHFRRKAGLNRADADVNAAAAAGAAQLPAAFLLWWIHAVANDPYGSGYGGAFGIACLVIFAPVYLPVLGLLHACVQTLPGAVVADLVPRQATFARQGAASGACSRRAGRKPSYWTYLGFRPVRRECVPGVATGRTLPVGALALRRVRWPWWVRHLLGTAVIGTLWALLGAMVWGWPFLTAGPVLVALGVLPVLAVGYARVRARNTGRMWGTWSIWWRAGVASVALFVLTLAGGLVAVTGLIEEYEAPELSAAQLAGVWRGDDGAVLRLRPDGRAELTRMPVEAGFEASEDFAVCQGTGRWSLDEESEYHARDGVVVRLESGSGSGSGSGTGSGCGNETAWTVAGTARFPELFVIFGDPDAGELRILKPAS